MLYAEHGVSHISQAGLLRWRVRQFSVRATEFRGNNFEEMCDTRPAWCRSQYRVIPRDGGWSRTAPCRPAAPSSWTAEETALFSLLAVNHTWVRKELAQACNGQDGSFCPVAVLSPPSISYQVWDRATIEVLQVHHVFSEVPQFRSLRPLPYKQIWRKLKLLPGMENPIA